MMKTIRLRISEVLLAEIDRTLVKHHYKSRTEFILDAIRSKLSELEKREMIQAVHNLRGISKRKTTDKQLHDAGERAFKEIERRFK